MDPKYRTRLSLLIALIVVAAVFGSFGYSVLSNRTPHIVLPSSSSGGGADSSSLPEDGFAQQLEVTPDTVQAVIASLERTGSYYRQLTAQTFWSGGSGTATVQTWVDDGYTYVRAALSSGQVRYSLTNPEGTVCYWYAGSSAWLTAPADSLSADLTQRIPTYEDVLRLDAASISAAGYETYEGHRCIYVEARTDGLDYLERYWISVDSGLLVAAQTVEDGDVIYSIHAATPIQTPCPDNVTFALPNGTVLHSF